MSDSTHYQLTNNISLTQVDDEAVLLNLESGSYYGLNHIGAALLNSLISKQSVQQSCTALADEYAMSEQTIIDDINQLLAQLLEQGLIEPQSE